MSEEYSIADIAGHVPKYEVIDGIFYCDGTKVERWQLSAEELEKYFPDKYVEKYGSEGIQCPYANCGYRVVGDIKTPLVQHMRAKHPEFYEKHKKALHETEGLPGMVAYVKAQFPTE